MDIFTSYSLRRYHSFLGSVRMIILNLLVTFWTLLILLPSFTLLNEVKYSIVLKTELSSILDKLTLADALMNPQVVNLVLIFTILYTAMTLHMIVFGLAVPM
jgi:hypothetical protein